MSNQFKNILVIVNFSNPSYEALTYAVKLAKEVKGTIKILHISDANCNFNGNNSQASSDIDVLTNDKTKSKLDSIIEMIETEGITAKYEHKFGNMQIEVEQYCNNHQPDLMIIANEKIKQKSFWNKFQKQQSIASTIMEKVHIPTLVL